MLRWKSLVVLSLVSVAVFAGSELRAAIVFSESFDTTPGELNGSAGTAAGLTGTWLADEPNTQIVSGGLSYNVVGGGTINGGSSSFALTGHDSAGPTASRALTTNFSGDVIYLRWLFQVGPGTGSTLDGSDVILSSLNSSASGDTPLRMGVRSNATNDFFADPLNGGTATESATGGNLVDGTTYLLVGRFTKTTPGAGNNFNQVSLWVNPAFGDSSTPLLTTASEASGISAISTLVFRIANAQTTDNFLVDEIVAGTTWNDVVPSAIPEPGTWFGLTAGLAIVALKVSRKK